MDEITLKLTSAIALDGEICPAKTLVTVTETLAKDLLRRGKGVLATEDDLVGADVHADDKPAKQPKAKRAAAPFPTLTE